MTQGSRAAALAAGIAIGATAAMAGAAAAQTVTVAYFLEWPTPNQRAQVEKTFDAEMGATVNWVSFGNGNEMTQAMVAGDVDIAYSQGFVPFVVGVTSGAPLKLVGIAVTYAENDLCIVRDDAGITAENATELEGKRVATPIGNVTHYKLLRTLDHLGVDASKVELVQMNPADAAIALVRGDVPMACAFGGPIDRMREVGAPLMTGAEQEAAGINTFDVITVTDRFAAAHPELVSTFLRVTEAENEAFKAEPDGFYEIVAGAAGMDVEAARATMENFGFPTTAEQLGPNWLGGGVVEATKGVADVMVEAGNLDAALDDYAAFVDPSFLE